MLIGSVVVVICGFLIFLVVSLISGTMVVRDRVMDTTDEMKLGKSSLFGSSFRIISARFYNRSLADENSVDPCTAGIEIVIVNLLFNNSALPDKCEITIDKAWQKSISVKEKGCRAGCAGDETLIAVDVKAQSVYDNHIVEVCCDLMCLEREIIPLCSKI